MITLITARVDESDSRKFKAFCESSGLNVSTAINLFIKAVVHENRIPFSVEEVHDPFYSPENQAYVMKSVRELREGKGRAHELIEAGDD